MTAAIFSIQSAIVSRALAFPITEDIKTFMKDFETSCVRTIQRESGALAPEVAAYADFHGDLRLESSVPELYCKECDMALVNVW